MRITIAIALLITALSVHAATPAEVTDQHLYEQLSKRLNKGKECKCACLREAKTLWEARRILRADLALDKLGQQIDADLAANKCNSTASSSKAPIGDNVRKPPSFTVGPGGGLTDMTRPDIYLAVGKLDASEQKKLYNELPVSAQTEWREWAAGNKEIAEKIYVEDLAKQLLDSASTTTTKEYSAEELAEILKKHDAKATKQPYQIDLNKIEKKYLKDTVKPPSE